jgi:hypothetical protein
MPNAICIVLVLEVVDKNELGQKHHPDHNLLFEPGIDSMGGSPGPG